MSGFSGVLPSLARDRKEERNNGSVCIVMFGEAGRNLRRQSSGNIISTTAIETILWQAVCTIAIEQASCTIS